MTRFSLILNVFLALPTLTFHGQTATNKELIGTWEFVKLNDKNGNKVDTIRDGHGWEIAGGPVITFKEDGSYSKQFTPINIDNGKWFYNKIERKIIYHLYFDTTSFAGKYLIEKGLAKKDESGEYYEEITDQVIELSSNTLIFLEKENRQSTYTKKNK